MGDGLKNKNKHGLSRRPPAEVRAKVRRQSGFGCVFCGTPFVDYEHIDPEFHSAKEHDPDRMTLLCPGCHAKVTRGRISKKDVRNAKENPKSRSAGFVKDLLYPSSDDVKICLGTTSFSMTAIPISIHGKPMLWFEPPEEKNSPVLVNAIFYDASSTPIAFINRNNFIGLVGDHDITADSSRITIRPAPRKIGLKLNSKGSEPINIERLEMSFLDSCISVSSKGSLVLKYGNSSLTLDSSSMTGGQVGIELGGIPKAPPRDKLGVIKNIEISRSIIKENPPEILSFNGTRLGWIIYGLIFDRSYMVVGKIDGDSAFSITGEYIGELNKYSEANDNLLTITTTKLERENGEPIWASPSELSCINLRKEIYYDLGYRLFSSPSYLTRTSFMPTGMPSVELDKEKTMPEEISTPIQPGDLVELSYEGTLGGKIFEGASASGTTLEIGSNRMIKGFEESIIGRLPGETYEVELALPKDHHTEALRSKTMAFSIAIGRAFRNRTSQEN